MDILGMIENLLGRGSVNRPGPDPRLQAIEEMMSGGAGQGVGAAGIRRAYPTRLQQDLQRRLEQGESLEGMDAHNLLNRSNPPEYDDEGGLQDDIMGY